MWWVALVIWGKSRLSHLQGEGEVGAVRTSECIGHHQGVGSILWALPQTPRAWALGFIGEEFVL